MSALDIVMSAGGSGNLNFVLNPDLSQDTTSFGTVDATVVAWNGSVFCAVGQYGRVATSTDGVTWTYRNGLRTTTWGGYYAPNGITWTGQVFCIVGGGARVATSPDGITWTYRSSLNTSGWPSGVDVLSVAYGGVNGYLLEPYPVIAVIGDGYAAYSTDHGVTWTAASDSGLNGQAEMRLTTISVGPYGGTKFVFVSRTGKSGWSYFGASYTTSTQLSTTDWGVNGSSYTFGIASTGPLVYAVGKSGRLVYSSDGLNWTYLTGLETTSWGTAAAMTLTWTGSLFVAGGQAGAIATSPDGVTWTYRSGLASTAWGVYDGSSDVLSSVWNGSKLCVVGEFGRQATSTDGVTWTFQNGLSLSQTKYSIGKGETPTSASNDPYADKSNAVIYANGQFVAVGIYGRVATSPDGVTWTYRGEYFPGYTSTESTYPRPFARAIAWNGSIYCAVGSTGYLMTSSDGVTWTYRTNLRAVWGTDYDVNGIAEKNGLFCVVGGNGKVATSSDGVTWTYQTGLVSSGWPSYVTPYSVASNGSIFIVGGQSGYVATSSDGVTWTTNSTGLGALVNWNYATVNAIAWNGLAFCAVGHRGGGEGGPIVTAQATSSDGVTWASTANLKNTTYGNRKTTSVVWTGAYFYVGGYGGAVAYSPNGVLWTYDPGIINAGWGSGNTYGGEIDSMAWSGNRLCAVGSYSQLVYSK